ncbi:GNAT family N-acetyltransferase [Isoptericola cucumis]|uniref:GNAT family N-acetyltransferase n=1 Tax=Isoptericola cucumis TaxID=1776856 RepID=UPI001E65A503|nr:N-acetyltransferase [Isoptericola cucumis]
MSTSSATPATGTTDQRTVVVQAARPAEAAEVAWLASVTFPLACPPGTPVTTMAAHVAAHLTPGAFRDWVASDRHALLVAVAADGSPAAGAVAGQHLLGYALVALGEPDGASERDALLAVAGDGPYAELSKIYVLPGAQGSGVASLLMAGAVAAAQDLDPHAPVWLGTNGENRRAQAFYRKHGFEVVGGRTYDVGGVLHDDVVMLRR